MAVEEIDIKRIRGTAADIEGAVVVTIEDQWSFAHDTKQIIVNDTLGFFRMAGISANNDFVGNNDFQGTFDIGSSGLAIDSIIDDDTFATASATSIATSESIKAYVDAAAGTFDPTDVQINGNLATAFRVQATTDVYILVDTTTGSEKIELGNAVDNPDFGFLGSGRVSIASLTASQAIFTDGSKNLVSNAITGSGSVAMSVSPAFTGTISSVNMDMSGDLKFEDGNGAIFGNGLDAKISWDGIDTLEIGDLVANPNFGFIGTGDVSFGGALQLGATVAVSSILDEDAMGSNSATALATQQSIKAYVDSQIHFDPTNINIADNTAEAFNVEEGTRHYINVDTTNGSEVITFGNAALDPNYTFLGGGTLQIGGDVTIGDGGNARDILMYTTDVSHPFTAWVPADTYGQVKAGISNNGGIEIKGFSEIGTTRGMRLLGALGTVSPTPNVPAIEIVGAMSNGTTGTAAIGASDDLIHFSNNSGGQVRFYGDGSAVFNGNMTIGSGAAGVNYTLTFNGEDNDGVITWMEDEDTFQFLDIIEATRGIHNDLGWGSVFTGLGDDVFWWNVNNTTTTALIAQAGSGIGLRVISNGPIVSFEDTNQVVMFSLSNEGVGVISNSLTIGSGAAGVDYTLTFNGENNDGIMEWDEDNNRWNFDSDLALENASTTVTMGSNLSKLIWRTSDSDSSLLEIGSIVMTAEADFGAGGAPSDMRISSSGGEGIRINSAQEAIAVVGLTVGIGAAGVDYTLTFNGETNDGIITWMEDEDYFKFSDDVNLDTLTASLPLALNGSKTMVSVAKSAAYTLNATVVVDRTLLASASATTINNNNVLAAVITDLQTANVFA
jgi:hypothetical protein